MWDTIYQRQTEYYYDDQEYCYDGCDGDGRGCDGDGRENANAQNSVVETDDDAQSDDACDAYGDRLDGDDGVADCDDDVCVDVASANVDDVQSQLCIDHLDCCRWLTR